MERGSMCKIDEEAVFGRLVEEKCHTASPRVKSHFQRKLGLTPWA